MSSVKNGQTSLLGPRGSHQGHQAVTSRTWRELWAARLRLDSKGWSMSWLSWWSLDGAGEIPNMAVCQNLVPLVNIKIAGKWMFIPLKMVLIGIDPYPYGKTSEKNTCGILLVLQISGFWTKPRKRFEAIPKSQFFGGPPMPVCQGVYDIPNKSK